MPPFRYFNRTVLRVERRRVAPPKHGRIWEDEISSVVPLVSDPHSLRAPFLPAPLPDLAMTRCIRQLGDWCCDRVIEVRGLMVGPGPQLPSEIYSPSLR